MKSCDIHSIYITDSRYPKLLREINDPPKILYYRGELADSKEACVAIVGSRKMSSYGIIALQKISTPLLDAGITIVSGLAYGIDSTAHSECVKRDARTIAVLGTGVDDESIYPKAHLRLAHDILDKGGLIISEQPPGTPGFKQNFIARNRIIAGLSLGVVIVECKTKSGALLTADFAADYNRNLYAVPGPIYSSLSEGPHKLIRDGAMLTTSGEEILEDLKVSVNQLPILKTPCLTDQEKLVLDCMRVAPATVNDITASTAIRSADIMHILTTLELKNVIINTGPQGFLVNNFAKK